MSRWLTTVAFFAVLAALVGAQGQSPSVSPADQAQLFHRNQKLVRATIESSVDLSKQEKNFDGFFIRADLCTNLAKRWAAEIDSAAKAQEPERASELTSLLGKVIDAGVAANLKLARDKIESGSQYEKELFRRRDDAIKVLEPLKSSLREIESAHKTVNDGIEKLNLAAKK